MDYDIVFVSTPLKADETHRGLCPSLSNLTLGSYLTHQGASVRVFDPSVEMDTAGAAPDLFLKDLAQHCVEMNPRFLGLSCLSPVEGKFGASLAREVKALDSSLHVVMGGLWSTTYASQILQKLPDIDAVVKGPGELAMEVLVKTPKGSHPAWDKAPGLIWRGGNNQEIPHYTTDLARPLDMSLLAKPKSYDIMVYLSSRGCPYRCSFCSEPIMFPAYVDEPLDKVKADIETFKALDKPYFFWVCDPIFGFNPRRVDELCHLLGQTPFDFLLETRVDVLKPDMVEQVAHAGCKLIYFGLESGSYRSLVELKKCNDRPQYERYIQGARSLTEACARNGIIPMFGVMNPVPGDRVEDLKECLDFLEELVSICAGINPDLGLFLLPLQCRLDMGSPFQLNWPSLEVRGMVRSCDEEDIFGDMFVTRTSSEVGPEEAKAFRQKVSALWTPSQNAMKVLSQCWPRPYMEIEWN
jgi:hypothetical protein